MPTWSERIPMIWDYVKHLWYDKDNKIKTLASKISSIEMDGYDMYLHFENEISDRMCYQVEQITFEEYLLIKSWE